MLYIRKVPCIASLMCNVYMQDTENNMEQCYKINPKWVILQWLFAKRNSRVLSRVNAWQKFQIPSVSYMPSIITIITVTNHVCLGLQFWGATTCYKNHLAMTIKKTKQNMKSWKPFRPPIITWWAAWKIIAWFASLGKCYSKLYLAGRTLV